MSSAAAAKQAPEATPLWGEVVAPKWEANRTAWLLTCVDLTSLLVGFFVLLFSTQTLQRDKWQAVTGSFQAQFAPRATVVAVVPDGADNAVVRVTGAKSGLAYLDTLLHQRVQGDAAWAGLHVETETDGAGRDMRYRIPAAFGEADVPATKEAWARLGGVVRGWKNPVGVRVYAAAGNELAAGRNAALLAAVLAANGVTGTFAEVRRGGGNEIELVVRAQ